MPWDFKLTQWQITITRSYKNTGSGPITEIIADVAELSLWSPCSDNAGRQGILNINFRAALTTTQTNNGTIPTGYFGPLEISGAEVYPVAETVDFKWRTCWLIIVLLECQTLQIDYVFNWLFPKRPERLEFKWLSISRHLMMCCCFWTKLWQWSAIFWTL